MAADRRLVAGAVIALGRAMAKSLAATGARRVIVDWHEKIAVAMAAPN
jgi:hypothetical protein